MTQAEIRTAVHNLIKEYSTDAGALLPSTNTLIDDYIDMALDMVVLDLVKVAPHRFTVNEDLDLTADTRATSPSASWLQITAANKLVASDSPTPLTYVELPDLSQYEYVGETIAEPLYYTLVGTDVWWVPTPSTTTTDYARFSFIVQSTMAETGPTYIPAIAHRLIPLRAAIIIGTAWEWYKTDKLEGFYQLMRSQVSDVIGFPVQHQQRSLASSKRRRVSTRDLTEYDRFSEDFFR